MPLPDPPYRGIDWDDSLEKLPRVAEITTRGALQVGRWLISHAHSRHLTLPLIQGMHRAIFADVFPDFAGRLRGPGPLGIPINVTFGTFRGEAYENVPSTMASLADRVQGLARRLDELRPALNAEQFSAEVLKVAAYTHCEIVRIHPFVNGNGRTARLCINYFAARYGFLPVDFARPQDDYLAANQAWLEQRRIEPLFEFLRPTWLPLADRS